MFFLVECNIPPVITGILAQVYKIILIVVPIGIVLFGSIDFVKAIVSKDQDTISKSTKTFITRIITGALTFFVLTIVTWLFRVIIGNVQGSSSALNCALQILGGESKYEQTNNNTNNDNNNSCSVETQCQFCTGYAKTACLEQWNKEKEELEYSCTIETNCIYCNPGHELDECKKNLKN